MEANPFVIAVVAVVVLAQVPLVAYLSRHLAVDPDADRPDPREGYVTYGTVDARPSTNERAAVGEDGAVACVQCGAVVDAGYEYCGACAGRLRSTGSPHGRSSGGRWSK